MLSKKVLFAADLHGIRYAYDKLFDIAKRESIDTIIIGGDVTPKKLAVKLKENYDVDKDIISDGEAIPLNLLNSSDGTDYLDSLLRVKSLNERYSPDKLANEEKNNGSIIYKIENAYYSLETMVMEYSVLNKLINLLRQKQENSEEIVAFTEEELDYLTDFMHVLKEYECNYSLEYKHSLAKKWNLCLRNRGVSFPKNGKYDRDFRFEELALSKNIELYLKYLGEINEIDDMGNQVEKFLKQKKSKSSDLFIQKIKDWVCQIKLAHLLIDLYDIESLLPLFKKTSLEQLLDLANRSEVYIQGQREFINGYLKDKLVEFKKINYGGEVYIILGNDDRFEIESDVKKLQDEHLIRYINQSVTKIEDLSIVGYNYVTGSKGKFYDGWEKDEECIKKDTDVIASLSDPKKTIYVFHSPPFGGVLDINYENQHVGSTSISRFIDTHQPLCVLSGHVHESYKKSNNVMERRGNTICFNFGGDHTQKKLRAAIIDLNNLADFKVMES